MHRAGDVRLVVRQQELADVHALCLVQQVECAGQISLRPAYQGHGDPSAIGVLWQPGLFAKLHGSQQMRCGGWQVAMLAANVAHPDVHVRGSPQRRPAVLNGPP